MKHAAKGTSQGRPLLALAILLCAGTAISLLFLNLPAFEPKHREKLRIPRSLEDAKELRVILLHYTETHPISVFVAFCLVFLTYSPNSQRLQTFCIPGTIFLSFLSGALFGFFIGFPLTVAMSTLGASSCYWLSALIGPRFLQRFIPDRLKWFQNELHKHQRHLFNYMLFVRISPLLPNWFVNVTSPIAGVPFPIFALATAIGVMPQTFLCVRAGLTLQQLKSTNDVINFQVLLTLALAAFMPLIPTFKPVQRFLRTWFKIGCD